MTSENTNRFGLAKLALGGVFTAATIAGGLALTASVPTEANALALYAQQQGNAACSTCHTTQGLSTNNMRDFTPAGKFFMNNGRTKLPPACNTPQALLLYDRNGNYVDEVFGCVLAK